MPEPQALPDVDRWSDLLPFLDAEVSRLPNKYRIPIVLCDLEGKTRREVARQLGIPVGTLSGRLTTARRMLAKRLAHYDLAFSDEALGVMLTQNSSPATLPASVATATIQAAMLTMAGTGTAEGMISVKVAALTEGVLKIMFLARLKTTTALLFVLSVICTAGGLLTYNTMGAEPSQKSQGPDQPTPLSAVQNKQTDASAGTGNAGKSRLERFAANNPQRDKRRVRWVLVFTTGPGKGSDYLKQLDSLGAILAYEAGDDKYMVVRNLKEKPVRPVQEDIRKFDMIWWVDDQPKSVRSLASALGINPPPEAFVAFFPAALEQELLDKELKVFQGKEEDIEETRFRLILRDGRYQPEVVSQRRKQR
jgi:hypothetical protein